MSLEIKGTIVAIMPVEIGTSAKGNEWKKQTAVLETAGQYPKKVAFEMFNDKIKELKIGDTVNIGFDVESREYQGKWYTNNIGAWKVEGASVPSVPQDGAGAPPPVDDLPY